MVKLTGLKKIKTAVFISGTGSNLKNLIKFSKTLERVCVETVESGSMTKDLAILIDKSAKYLTTNEFLEAINSNLKKKLN